MSIWHRPKQIIKTQLAKRGYVLERSASLPRRVQEMGFITLAPNQTWYYERADKLPSGIELERDLERLVNYYNLSVKTIIDVGANQGQSALRFHRAFPQARVFSFEPVSGTFQRLAENTRGCPNIHISKIALGAQPDTATIQLQSNSEWNSLTNGVNVARTEGAASETVEIQTLDEFARANQIERIDLLKTDTEGYDLCVLEGSRKLLEAQRISLVLAEVGFGTSKRHTSFVELTRWLDAYHFGLYAFYEMVHHPMDWRVLYANALFVNLKLAPNKPA